MSAPLPVLRMGDPRLRIVAEAVRPEALTDALRQGADVAGTLADFRGRFGWGRALAAPQVGVGLRMVAFDFGGGPFLALNPEIIWRSDETAIVLDDCLCLPEIVAPVRRHVSVTMAYQDESLRPQRLERLPFDLAELVQHETDHLDGILFIDRITDPSQIVAREHKALLAGSSSTSAVELPT